MLHFESLNSTNGSDYPKVSAFFKFFAFIANTLTDPGNLGMAALASSSNFFFNSSYFYYSANSSYKLTGYFSYNKGSPSIISWVYK